MSHSKKKTKFKYHKISFAISEKEKLILNRFCQQEKISLKTLYKKSVRLYVNERNAEIERQENISKNQLDLFKPNPPYQNKLIF